MAYDYPDPPQPQSGNTTALETAIVTLQTDETADDTAFSALSVVVDKKLDKLALPKDWIAGEDVKAGYRRYFYVHDTGLMVAPYTNFSRVRVLVESKSDRKTGAAFDGAESANWTYLDQNRLGSYLGGETVVIGYRHKATDGKVYKSLINGKIRSTFLNTQWEEVVAPLPEIEPYALKTELPKPTTVWYDTSSGALSTWYRRWLLRGTLNSISFDYTDPNNSAVVKNFTVNDLSTGFTDDGFYGGKANHWDVAGVSGQVHLVVCLYTDNSFVINVFDRTTFSIHSKISNVIANGLPVDNSPLFIGAAVALKSDIPAIPARSYFGAQQQGLTQSVPSATAGYANATRMPMGSDRDSLNFTESGGIVTVGAGAAGTYSITARGAINDNGGGATRYYIYLGKNNTMIRSLEVSQAASSSLNFSIGAIQILAVGDTLDLRAHASGGEAGTLTSVDFMVSRV
jgi:hypothetical protein